MSGHTSATWQGELAGGSFDDHAGRWMVLWTRSRQEKAVANFLQARRTVCYLPLVARVSMVRGRKFRSWVPLFPGYVFAAGQREDAYAAIASKRVCQMLPIADQDSFVREMRNVHDAVNGDGELELYPHAVVGRRCRVTGGAFMGVEGVITDRLGPDRLVLHIGILGRGASLEIDADLLEPLDD